MKWYWKLTIALGFVGAVAMAAAAFAQSDSGGPAPTASATAQAQTRARLGGLGMRIVHGDLTLNTRRGIVDARIDGGTVTSVDPGALTLTIKRADGHSVSFTATGSTRVRKDGAKASFSDIENGDFVQVVQVDRGNGYVVALIRDRGAGPTTTSQASAGGL